MGEVDDILREALEVKPDDRVTLLGHLATVLRQQAAEADKMTDAKGVGVVTLRMTTTAARRLAYDVEELAGLLGAPQTGDTG